MTVGFNAPPFMLHFKQKDKFCYSNIHKKKSSNALSWFGFN